MIALNRKLLFLDRWINLIQISHDRYINMYDRMRVKHTDKAIIGLAIINNVIRPIATAISQQHYGRIDSILNNMSIRRIFSNIGTIVV